MRRACKYCGRIVDYDHDCPKKPKQFNKREDSEQGRYTTEWKHKSADIKERSLYLCAVCRDHNTYTYSNLETHHIVSLRERPELLLEDSNLICLCGRHHEQAERGEIDKAYLYALVAKRDIPPSRYDFSVGNVGEPRGGYRT